MKSIQVIPVALLLLITLLTGCIGGDDGLDTNDDSDEQAQGDGARVTGRILTTHLDPVNGATVALVTQESELADETTTDSDGRYALGNVEPGQYRLQVNAPCCRENVRAISVSQAEAIQVDLQLEPFSEADLQAPFIERYEWKGFMSCGYVVMILAGDACADVDDASDRTHTFQIEPGLKTLTATLVWGSPGVAGDRLQYGLARDPCDGATCNTPGDYYGYNSGESPVDLRIDEGEGNGSQSWADMDETMDVQLRVFPEFDNVNVFYQQEFTVYYHLHYHAKAPEGYDPSPDQ